MCCHRLLRATTTSVVVAANKTPSLPNQMRRVPTIHLAFQHRFEEAGNRENCLSFHKITFCAGIGFCKDFCCSVRFSCLRTLPPPSIWICQFEFLRSSARMRHQVCNYRPAGELTPETQPSFELSTALILSTQPAQSHPFRVQGMQGFLLPLQCQLQHCSQLQYMSNNYQPSPFPALCRSLLPLILCSEISLLRHSTPHPLQRSYADNQYDSKTRRELGRGSAHNIELLPSSREPRESLDCERDRTGASALPS